MKLGNGIKLGLIVAGLTLVIPVKAALLKSQVIDGFTWYYSVNEDGEAVVEYYPTKVWDNFYEDFYEGSLYATLPGLGRLGYGKQLVIPSMLGGCPVVHISERVFWNCRGLTSVTIPEGVRSIGDSAFSGCWGLTSVVIPEGVTSIGNSAFEDCYGLTSVVIPEGVTSIGDYAFFNCYGLTSVVIPEGVTSIGRSAFLGCSGLMRVVIPEGVTSIGDSAFYGCSARVVIPEGVARIGEHAFYGCDIVVVDEDSVDGILFNKDKNILILCPQGFQGECVIPEGVTNIGNVAFYDCRGLTSVVIPEGVTSIGDSAFYGCSGLTSVVIPEGVTSIGNSAFSGCSGLTSVVIPEGVTSIGDSAFSDCRGLTRIVIPSSVTYVGGSAFTGCFCAYEFKGDVPRNCMEWGSVVCWKDGCGGLAYPAEFADEWKRAIALLKKMDRDGFQNKAYVSVSAKMITPKLMSVKYTVQNARSIVKTRAVAFKDGVRSFNKIVPVRSGENVPNGAEVAGNTTHEFTWNVPEDWDIDLAKVKVEILVQEGQLLPQELVTIPANGTKKEMTITVNSITEDMAFNALLWCYAEGDDALTLSDGVLKANGTTINGTTLSSGNSYRPLLNYLYGKMGYKVLEGADLWYAEKMTRIDFATSGIGQVSVKIEE